MPLIVADVPLDHEGSALMDGRAGDIAVHVDGFYRDAGNYDTPVGKQANSFFNGYGETVGASYFFGPDKGSHVGAAVIQYNSQYGIPSDTTYIDMQQTKFVTKSSFDLGGGLLKTLKIDGSYADYAHSEKQPDGTVLSTFRNKEFDGRAELLFGKIGFIDNTALGFEVQNRKFQALGEGSNYLLPTQTQNYAGYLFTEAKLTDRLKVQASGRVEHVIVEGTPISNVFTRVNYTPLSGAIGALYDVGDAIKLGFTFASTGRAPGITELFSRGAHDGPGTFETGDPRLKVERANSIEATLRIRSGRFRFEGSAYSTWFNNYIYGDLTGRTCDDAGICAANDSGELRELFYRQQGAHFRGLEGEANFAVVKSGADTLNVKAIADYTRATLDNGGNVPRIPPYRYGGGLTWTSDLFDAGFLMTHSARQDKFGAFDTPTPGFNSLGANLAVRPFKAYQGIEFAVVGQNLTNDVMRNAAALNKDDVIMPGRNIRFIVKVATF